jgi:hypothetical protein
MHYFFERIPFILCRVIHIFGHNLYSKTVIFENLLFLGTQYSYFLYTLNIRILAVTCGITE